jgi:hypothetical protein
MQQRDLIDLFILPLEQARFEYMVTGSVASTIYGEPRLTHDIDLVLLLRVSDIEKFSSIFPSSEYYCPPPEIIRIELSRQNYAHFNLIHHESGYKADFYPFTGNTLHSWALKNINIIPISSDLQLKVAPPEYVILRKLQYYREGRSEKHCSDIRKMLSLATFPIDRIIIEEWVSELELTKEWNYVLNG